jgi:hypothetical protein
VDGHVEDVTFQYLEREERAAACRALPPQER